MATEFALERSDCAAIGSFEEVKALLCEVVPTVKFGWALSGPEKLKIATERGIEFPDVLRKAMETFPSLLEGRAEQKDWMLELGLGHSEQVLCLYLTPRGADEKGELQQILTALEARIGGTIVVSGEEQNRLT